MPTYNERENIAPLVERVHKSLSSYSYEFIVVDDNSPDGTSELAKSFSLKYPLRVIVHKNERGLASAVVAGFNRARGINYLISNLFGIAGAMIWNFTANVRWTWRAKARGRAAIWP